MKQIFHLSRSVFSMLEVVKPRGKMKGKWIIFIGIFFVANLFAGLSDAAGDAKYWTPMCGPDITMRIVQDDTKKGMLHFSVITETKNGYNLFPMWRPHKLNSSALRGISFSIKIVAPENGVIGEKGTLIFPGSRQTFELKRDDQWQAVKFMLKKPEGGWPDNWGFFQLMISVPKGGKAAFSLKDITFLDADGNAL